MVLLKVFYASNILACFIQEQNLCNYIHTNIDPYEEYTFHIFYSLHFYMCTNKIFKDLLEGTFLICTTWKPQQEPKYLQLVI